MFRVGGQVQPQGGAHAVVLQRDADQTLVWPVAQAVPDQADQVSPSGPRAGRAVSMSRDETQKIRKWAAENGYNPSPRGRISQAIERGYDAAQG